MHSKKLFIFLITILLFSAGVNAELFLSQPDDFYNLGENLDVKFSVNQSSSASGLVQLSLNCPEKSITFYAIYTEVSANEEKSFDAFMPLEDIIGECSLQANFGSQAINSKKFIITDRIDVSFDTNKQEFLPEEIVEITGSAVKANSEKVNGFAEIAILDSKNTVEVDNGAFTFSFSLPQTTSPREYTISAFIFEQDKNEKITNKGYSSRKILVKSVPSRLTLTINKESLLPGENFIAKSAIYDQASNIIQGNIALEVISPSGEPVFLEVSEGLLDYQLPENATAGEWKVQAKALELENTRIFYVEEYPNLSAQLAGNNIIVRNTGNMPYKNSTEITFFSKDSNESKVVSLDINLGVGEESEFYLTAPNGNYDLAVAGSVFPTVPLTGRATAAIELTEQSVLSKYPLLSYGIFLALVIMLIILSLGMRKRGFEYNAVRSFSPMKKKPDEGSFVRDIRPAVIQRDKAPSSVAVPIKEDNSYKAHVYPPRKLEAAAVLHGSRQNASVLVVKEKNLSSLRAKLEPQALAAVRDFFNKTSERILSKYSGVYQKVDDSTFLAVFSPVNRQFRHESSSVKAALELKKAFDEYNKKLRDKFNFGIGLNSGELVIQAGTTVQYASVGNTIAVAKKIADYSNSQVLMSREIYRRISSEIKASRIGSVPTTAGEVDIYSMQEFVVRDAYKGYVSEIVSRIKTEEGKGK